MIVLFVWNFPGGAATQAPRLAAIRFERILLDSKHALDDNMFCHPRLCASLLPQVKINGDVIGDFGSQGVMTSFGVEEDEVLTVAFESIDIGKDEWISLLEVSNARKLPSSRGFSIHARRASTWISCVARLFF